MPPSATQQSKLGPCLRNDRGVEGSLYISEALGFSGNVDGVALSCDMSVNIDSVAVSWDKCLYISNFPSLITIIVSK